MRRPNGVVLVAISLGLCAFGLACIGVMSLLTLMFLGSVPPSGQVPAGPHPSSAVMQVTFIGSALFYIALAAWCGTTIYGLMTMKLWARYSTIVLGAGLAVVAITSAAIAALLMMHVPPPPTTLPSSQSIPLFHAVMGIMTAFTLVLAGMGAWWMTYCLLRRTREAFAWAAADRAQIKAGYAPMQRQPLSFGTAAYGQEVATPLPLDTPTEPRRPVVITVLAWLFLAGSAFMLLFLLLPMPMFFLGHILTGWSSKVLVIGFAALSGVAGLGMLRLERVGLYAAYLTYGLGIVNSAAMLVPSYREKLMSYSDGISRAMMGGTLPATTPVDPHTHALMMIPGALMGTGLTVTVLVLLVRERKAFNR